MGKIWTWAKDYWYISVPVTLLIIWFIWTMYFAPPDFSDKANKVKLANAMFDYLKAKEGKPESERADYTTQSTSAGFWGNAQAFTWFGLSAGNLNSASQKQLEEVYKVVKEYYKR